MITITARGITWTVLVLALAGFAVVAAFWVITGRLSGREALAAFITIVTAAAAAAWLRGQRGRRRQGGQS
jgi:hypothetical protein